MLDEEIWKVVKITKTRRYEVSSFGRRRVTSIKTNKILKLDYGGGITDYLDFGLLGRAHRAIAEAFIPNPENKPCVNHKDGNKSNNHVSNLEWCTYTENIRHAFDTGLNDIEKARERMALLGKSQYGLKNPAANLNIYSFIHSSGLIENCTMYELRTKYKINRGNLSEVVKGTRLKACGWSLLNKEENVK